MFDNTPLCRYNQGIKQNTSCQYNFGIMVRESLPFRPKETTIGTGKVVPFLCWQDTRPAFLFSMELLEQKIVQCGKVVGPEILKVDSFLNHQLDIALLHALGQDVYEHFKHCAVSKVLTVEASGIAYACMIAQFFCCDVVFAKKSHTKQMSADCYTANVHSFTHGNDNVILVDKQYITAADNVLVVDDFLANGAALAGLLSIVRQASASLVGCAVAIEKGFQGGGDALRATGVDVYAQAIVEKMGEDGIVFRR